MNGILQESVHIARLLDMQAECKKLMNETGLNNRDLKSVLLRWKSNHEPIDEMDRLIWTRFNRFKKQQENDDDTY